MNNIYFNMIIYYIKIKKKLLKKTISILEFIKIKKYYQHIKKLSIHFNILKIQIYN